MSITDSGRALTWDHTLVWSACNLWAEDVCLGLDIRRQRRLGSVRPSPPCCSSVRASRCGHIGVGPDCSPRRLPSKRCATRRARSLSRRGPSGGPRPAWLPSARIEASGPIGLGAVVRFTRVARTPSAVDAQRRVSEVSNGSQRTPRGCLFRFERPVELENVWRCQYRSAVRYLR